MAIKICVILSRQLTHCVLNTSPCSDLWRAQEFHIRAYAKRPDYFLFVYLPTPRRQSFRALWDKTPPAGRSSAALSVLFNCV